MWLRDSLPPDTISRPRALAPTPHVPDNGVMRRPSTSNVVLAVVTLLVIVLAVVAAMASTRRASTPPGTSTPQGVARTYVAAIIEGDDDTAVAQLDPALGCTTPLPPDWAPDSATVSLVSTDTSGTTATVVLEITEGTGGGPLFGEPYSHRETLSLVQRDGRWLIDGEPWPLYSCRDW